MRGTDLHLAGHVAVDGHRLRIYVADELELPWTSFGDLLRFLGLPREDDLRAILEMDSPHSVRRGNDGASAVSYCCASEFVEGFASPARAMAWKDAVRDVWIALCDAPTDLEWVARMRQSRDRSLEIAHDGFRRVRAMASRH